MLETTVCDVFALAQVDGGDIGTALREVFEAIICNLVASIQ